MMRLSDKIASARPQKWPQGPAAVAAHQYGIPEDVLNRVLDALVDAGLASLMQRFSMARKVAERVAPSWSAAVETLGREPTREERTVITDRIAQEVVRDLRELKARKRARSRAWWRTFGRGLVAVALTAATAGAAAPLVGAVGVAKASLDADTAGKAAEMEARYQALADSIGDILERSKDPADFYSRLDREAQGAAAYWRSRPGFDDAVRKYFLLRSAVRRDAGLSGLRQRSRIA